MVLRRRNTNNLTLLKSIYFIKIYKLLITNYEYYLVETMMLLKIDCSYIHYLIRLWPFRFISQLSKGSWEQARLWFCVKHDWSSHQLGGNYKTTEAEVTGKVYLSNASSRVLYNKRIDKSAKFQPWTVGSSDGSIPRTQKQLSHRHSKQGEIIFYCFS